MRNKKVIKYLYHRTSKVTDRKAETLNPNYEYQQYFDSKHREDFNLNEPRSQSQIDDLDYLSENEVQNSSKNYSFIFRIR